MHNVAATHENGARCAVRRRNEPFNGFANHADRVAYWHGISTIVDLFSKTALSAGYSHKELCGFFMVYSSREKLFELPKNKRIIAPLYNRWFALEGMLNEFMGKKLSNYSEGERAAILRYVTVRFATEYFGSDAQLYKRYENLRKSLI